MNLLLTWHSFLRRNLVWLERLLTAAGFSYLLAEFLRAFPVYPLYWDTTLTVLVFLLLLFSPLLGYFALLAAFAYPLFVLSPYLAVFFIIIALLGQHWFIPNLSGILLVVLTPTLSGGYLAWLAPLLGGLWWGTPGGLLLGGLSALWGKLQAGLAGLNPDWLTLFGVIPDTSAALGNFRQSNSLAALYQLFLPIMPDSTAVLYHLLQIGAWMLTGWLTAQLAQKDWAQYRRPRSTLMIAALGAALLTVLHAALAAWLRPEVFPAALQALALTGLVSALTVMLAEALVFFFENPWGLISRSHLTSSLGVRPEPAVKIEVPETAPLPQAADDIKLKEASTDDPPDDDDSLILMELD